MLKSLNVDVTYRTEGGYFTKSDFRSARCTPQIVAFGALSELMLAAAHGGFLESFMDHAEQTSRDIGGAYAESAVSQ